MLCFAFLAGIVGVASDQDYDGSRIAAGPFKWQEGCSPDGYQPGDRLPAACFDRFQRISHDWTLVHGLRLKDGGRGKTRYYRLGNDAVQPLCVAWEVSCTIMVIYADLFVVDAKLAGTSSADWRTLAPDEKP